MKIIVTTMFDENTMPVSKITSDRIVEYCKLHDYNFIFNQLSNRLNPWDKLIHIVNLLKANRCDYICWIDIDIYILDLKYKLEDLIIDINKEIHISTDNSGLCTGFIIIKNNEKSLKLFDTLHFLNTQNPRRELTYKNECGGFPTYDTKIEQNPLKILCHYFENVERMMSHIPQSIIMNPASSDQVNPFMFHFWSHGWNEKEKMMKHLSKLENGIVNIEELKRWYE